MEPPQTGEFVTWNKHSIYNCVELCIPNNPVLLSKLVYSFKEINNSFYKLTWNIRISVSGIQFFLIWHVPCWPVLIDMGDRYLRIIIVLHQNIKNTNLALGGIVIVLMETSKTWPSSFGAHFVRTKAIFVYVQTLFLVYFCVLLDTLYAVLSSFCKAIWHVLSSSIKSTTFGMCCSRVPL